MMILRLAAHRAFFFNATQWYQPESAGGFHRKKNLSRDDLKPIPSRRKIGRLIFSRYDVCTIRDQDLPCGSANPTSCN